MAEPTPPEEINLIIKRGLLDNRERQLIITPDYIQFDDRKLLTDPHTVFKKDEITDFRYGIRWIEGMYFTIGREYEIYIRNAQGKVIKISFKSLYGINKNKFYKVYTDILDAIWKFYFDDLTKILLQKYILGEDIQIGKIQLTQRNVIIKSSGIFLEQDKEIPWDKIRTKEYVSYFAVYSKDDATNINAGYYYHQDWNSLVLKYVLQSILDEKRIRNN